MKILQINSVCGIRSTGRICTDLARAAQAQGHEVKIAYGRETVPEPFIPDAVRIGNDRSVKIDALKTRILDNAGLNSAAATHRFIRWIKEYDPDIIHLHNIHGYYIHIGHLFTYLKEADKPVVWTLHDCWPFTGHCAYFDFAGCDRWKTGCYSCPQKRGYPASLLCDRSEKNYGDKRALFTGVSRMTLVTPSRWLAELVQHSFLSDYPVQVIPNGIDTAVFKPTASDFRHRHKLENKKIVLGAAGVWEKRKGLEDFIRLSAVLDDSCRIVLVGLNEEQRRSLPPAILGLPRTESAAKLAEIYSAADVFINPTYEDNYPTVNLEVQACGTPVITYNTGGSPESVPAASVVEKGDVAALAARVVACKGLDITAPADKRETCEMYMELYKDGLAK